MHRSFVDAVESKFLFSVCCSKFFIFVSWFIKSPTQLSKLTDLILIALLSTYTHLQAQQIRRLTLLIGEGLWIFSEYAPQYSVLPSIYICWHPCVAGLADRERQAHLQVWPYCGVGDTPGFTHHSALPPHTQPSGKSYTKACLGVLY